MKYFLFAACESCGLVYWADSIGISNPEISVGFGTPCKACGHSSYRVIPGKEMSIKMYMSAPSIEYPGKDWTKEDPRKE